jgi:DNA-binding MarR family transcriptional regulator
VATVVALFTAQRFISAAAEKRLRAETGLSLAQYEVLARLAGATEGRLRMVDISDGMCVSKSGVTQLVDTLEEAGLVGREFSRSDRRLTYAVLTAEGRKALERSAPVFAPVLQEYFAQHLSEHEMACLRGAMAKVLEGNRARGQASQPDRPDQAGHAPKAPQAGHAGPVIETEKAPTQS